jgi:hypothetical protein
MSFHNSKTLNLKDLYAKLLTDVEDAPEIVRFS